jgi:hypothetical protein
MVRFHLIDPLQEAEHFTVNNRGQGHPHFPLGLEVTARNLKGVTIKDALDAIYKQFKKKVFELPVLSTEKMHLTRTAHRLMTNWTSPTSLASSGTRKSAGHVSLFTRQSRALLLSRQARSPRRRPRKKRRLAVL